MVVWRVSQRSTRRRRDSPRRKRACMSDMIPLTPFRAQRAAWTRGDRTLRMTTVGRVEVALTGGCSSSCSQQVAVSTMPQSLVPEPTCLPFGTLRQSATVVGGPKVCKSSEICDDCTSVSCTALLPPDRSYSPVLHRCSCSPSCSPDGARQTNPATQPSEGYT